MRTDSVNLSDEAVGAARGLVERRYGSDYLSPKPRRYATKAKGAQEAHEAIRPAGTEMPTASELGLSGAEAKLYDLIWKRTVATQMADARLAFTNVSLEATAADGRRAEFKASGREVLFPGFFRAYVEGSDDPEAALDDQSAPLPSLDEGQSVACDGLSPEGHETRPPARYTEATLVKALEAEGIGRPSTYASIIDTIRSRGYVFSSVRQLVPSFTGIAVTQLLERTHRDIVDTEFTADMERTLDGLAEGGDAREFLGRFYEENVLGGLRDANDIHPREVCAIDIPNADCTVRVGRYGPYIEHLPEGAEKALTVSLPAETPPADLTREMVAELITRRERGDEPLGKDPDTGLPVYVLTGRFGPYVQLGDVDKDGEKPKRASLPKTLTPEDVTLDKALSLLALPRLVGNHPDDGEPITSDIGRYGPYVKHAGVFASLEKDDDPLTVELDRALELLAKKKSKGRREALRDLGPHPSDGAPVQLFDGRFGPYVKHGKINASLPKGADPDKLGMEEAVQLLAARAAAPKKKTTRRKKS
jgi:DNA topoisomerase-1